MLDYFSKDATEVGTDLECLDIASNGTGPFSFPSLKFPELRVSDNALGPLNLTTAQTNNYFKSLHQVLVAGSPELFSLLVA